VTHLSAWKAFNKAIGGNGDVGIRHETYVVPPGNIETLYRNMPRRRSPTPADAPSGRPTTARTHSGASARSSRSGDDPRCGRFAVSVARAPG
jgi:hypothetical protein